MGRTDHFKNNGENMMTLQTSIGVETILNQIRPLDVESQQVIFRQLEKMMKTKIDTEKPQYRLTELTRSTKVYSDPNADDETRRKQIDDDIRRKHESWERKPGTDSVKLRISDLWGVGAEIWQNESVNDYVRKERDSWG